MKKTNGHLQKILAGLLSGLLVLTAVVCAAVRLRQAELPSDWNLMAAETVFPTVGANVPESSTQESEPVQESDEPAVQENSTVTADSSQITSSSSESSQKKQNSDMKENTFEASEPTEEELQEYAAKHEGEEEYPVNEFTITQGNQGFGNVQIKNTSSTDIDIKKELESRLGFAIEDTDKPQVLIYHTHTSESFLTYDTGYFYESFYPRTTDTSQNICSVGEEIAKQLNAAGIKTIHDTTLHDYPSYNGAYDRSYDTVMSYLEKYPSIKVTLDIHRDGIGTDTQKTKPVFTVNGKKAAQIMILSGYNEDGWEGFKDWEYNLRFALQIQKTAAEMYPGMVRPLNFSDFMYNMNINTGSLLIEMGAESNTLEEVRYAGYLLGNVLAEVLKKSRTE